MIGTCRRRGFTITELVVVIIVIIFLLVLLIPALQVSHPRPRRAACLNNLKQIGLALQNMESALKRFPPSCHVEKDADGNITSVEGWSWCVDILPYIEYKALWDTLNTVDGLPLDGMPAHSDALATVIFSFQCPSFDGSEYVDPGTRAEVITNYKAMGATHLESLNVASPNPTTPKYAPDLDRHPDGAIYPGSTHGVAGFKTDGTSRTIIVVESKEENVARRTVGKECTVVGLPPVVTFAQSSDHPYCYPTGYTGEKFWDESTIPPDNNKTYLNWDYENNPYTDGGVSTPSAAASGPMKYGPSSDHPGVTNHLCADGSVHSISNQIDAALYMFMITRNGGDPMPGFEPE